MEIESHKERYGFFPPSWILFLQIIFFLPLLPTLSISQFIEHGLHYLLADIDGTTAALTRPSTAMKNIG